MRIRGRLIAVVVLVAAASALLALRASGPGAERAPVPAADRSAPDPVSAAARFLTGLDLGTLLNPRRRRAHVERWAARSTATDLQGLYAAEAERLQGMRSGVARAALVGYRTRRGGRTRVTVELWAASLASTGEAPPATSWRTVAVDLVLERHGWRVETVRDVSGPAFDLPAQEFRREARQFQRFRVAP